MEPKTTLENRLAFWNDMQKLKPAAEQEAILPAAVPQTIIEEERLREPEATCAADLVDERYIAARAAWLAQCDARSAENIRLIKEQERLERVAAQKKWDEDFEESRRPHPMELTKVEQAYQDTEREKRLAAMSPLDRELLAKLAEPEATLPRVQADEENEWLKPRTPRRIAYLCTVETDSQREARLRNDSARISHHSR